MDNAGAVQESYMFRPRMATPLFLNVVLHRRQKKKLFQDADADKHVLQKYLFYPRCLGFSFPFLYPKKKIDYQLLCLDRPGKNPTSQ